MRLSAIDALQHGVLNLRANWKLIFVQAAQSFLVLAISVAGLVPVFMVLGFAFVREAFGRLGTGGELELVERLFESGPLLVVALLVMTLIWTVAFVVYCYFQGGILGVLVGGERNAQAGGSGWKRFRAFSGSDFLAHAERLTWPIFWLVNLFLAAALLILLVFLVLGSLLMTMVVGESFGAGAGLESFSQFGTGLVLLGCMFVVFMMLFSLFFTVWMQVALAELATGAGGVFAAVRAGLSTMSRRLPGLALLFLLLIVASIAMAVVTTPLSLFVEFALRDRMSLYLTGQAALTVLQWLVTGVVNLGWAGTVVALVDGEHRERG